MWTNHFSDAMLFLVGFGIIGFSQILDVNWTPVRFLTFIVVSLVVLAGRLVTALHRIGRSHSLLTFIHIGFIELQEFEPKLWSFVIAVVAVLGVGVPVALGAVSAHWV
jgi:hypothetical protein